MRISIKSTLFLVIHLFLSLVTTLFANEPETYINLSEDGKTVQLCIAGEIFEQKTPTTQDGWMRLSKSLVTVIKKYDDASRAKNEAVVQIVKETEYVVDKQLTEYILSIQESNVESSVKLDTIEGDIASIREQLLNNPRDSPDTSKNNNDKQLVNLGVGSSFAAGIPMDLSESSFSLIGILDIKSISIMPTIGINLNNASIRWSVNVLYWFF